MAYCLIPVTLFVTILFWLQSSTRYGIGILKSTFPDSSNSPVSFSRKWQVLGPFRCGTREAVWGADPLEYWGGFSNLSYNEEVEFNSPLATNGTARWNVIEATTSSFTTGLGKAEIEVRFPEVDWSFLQSIYGWSALQYQTWIRGKLRLNKSSPQSMAIYAIGILEFSINGKRHFGGDFYSYRRAPLILNLPPGEHVIELRLIRDVRALGGLEEPTIKVAIEAEIRREIISVDEQSLLIPETTNGKLGSVWASIDVQNNVDDWIEVLLVSSDKVPLTIKKALHLAPYQIRPVVFQFTANKILEDSFPVDVTYRAFQDKEVHKIIRFWVKFADRSIFEPQRLTYLHPAGIVSYAILRPPLLDSSCANNQMNHSVPLMIGLHGAGLEADSLQVRQMLDAAYGLCAWKLFPSGVTSWSGDDWHTWGVADIKAAVSAVSEWITAINPDGPEITPDEWVAIGHSNGGQGVWFLATHYPDNMLAIAPISAYSSIENYVPYDLWQDSEPLLFSILQQSRSSFKHETLVENLAGIPILQQHGSKDTNVPVYHARLMHELIEKAHWSSQYDELADKDHWFDGVMTTPSLLNFYENSLRSPRSTIPHTYVLSVPSSGDMASKGGVYVDQMESPDMNGRIKARRDLKSKALFVQTQNIYRFHLSAEVCQTGFPLALVIDNASQPFEVNLDQCESTWYVKDALGRWTVSKNSDWQGLDQRYGRQVGAMDAILRSEGLFTIIMCSAGIEHVALQISRNLLQYFAADSHITSQYDLMTPPSLGDQEAGSGNIVTLSIGDDKLPGPAHFSFPIRIGAGRISLFKDCYRATSDGFVDIDITKQCQHNYTYSYENAVGALFLRPLENQGLELVVWGADINGLEQAARLVPTLTGAGQPEFLILADSCRWKGHAGLYAAGHFDKFWQISSGSYIRTGI